VILLDTHVLLWLITGDEKLGLTSRQMIDKSFQKNEIALSAISFWEIALLKQKSRIVFNEDIQNWRKELPNQGVQEIPINGELAVISTTLENFHADPADRFIVTSALINNATLMTVDSKILNWNSPLDRMNARH